MSLDNLTSFVVMAVFLTLPLCAMSVEQYPPDVFTFHSQVCGSPFDVPGRCPMTIAWQHFIYEDGTRYFLMRYEGDWLWGADMKEVVFDAQASAELPGYP